MEYPIRAASVAEQVAARLRGQILAGEIDGGAIRNYGQITAEFGVSLPSAREAVRILEAEGLATIRRGKHGGAEIQPPKRSKVSYMIALLLEVDGVETVEVAAALRLLEPICAGACASRPDRAKTVLPLLEQLYQESEDRIDDPSAFAKLARRFHEVLVDQCGNAAVRIVVGSVEQVWSAQADYDQTDTLGAYRSKSIRQRSQIDHRELIDRIAAGDVHGAEQAASAHMSRRGSHGRTDRGRPVLSGLLRDG